MNDIVIYNSTEYKIESICKLIIEDILTLLDVENASLSINFVSNEEIQDINFKYRDKNNVTDVITFSYEEEESFNDLFDVRELGDVFIAVDYVYSNSINYKHTMAREMSFVLAHGILHMLGYDHQTKEEEEVMFSKQEEIIVNVIEKGYKLNEIFN